MRGPTRRGGGAALLALVAVLAPGCGRARLPPAVPPAPFRFDADTFAFANETVGEYHADPTTGRMTWTFRDPRPAFALRCGNMARAARQFHLNARFDPDRPKVDAGTYRELVVRVLAQDPRQLTPAPDPVVIPGYRDLRTFSAEHAALVQAALGGPSPSYLQRGNWRMIFPFTEGQQEEQATALLAALRRGETPIVHVLRFPDLAVNHLVVFYAATETPAAVEFEVYDPNEADRPLRIAWDRGRRSFLYPRTIYFYGGPVRAYAVYQGLLY